MILNSFFFSLFATFSAGTLLSALCLPHTESEQDVSPGRRYGTVGLYHGGTWCISVICWVASVEVVSYLVMQINLPTCQPANLPICQYASQYVNLPNLRSMSAGAVLRTYPPPYGPIAGLTRPFVSGAFSPIRWRMRMQFTLLP